jgi:hypothetical protein
MRDRDTADTDAFAHAFARAYALAEPEPERDPVAESYRLAVFYTRHRLTIAEWNRDAHARAVARRDAGTVDPDVDTYYPGLR